MNPSKERLFLHFNYQENDRSSLTVWIKTERKIVNQSIFASIKGEPKAYLQEPLVKSNILWGHPFQSFSQKKYKLQI